MEDQTRQPQIVPDIPTTSWRLVITTWIPQNFFPNQSFNTIHSATDALKKRAKKFP